MRQVSAFIVALAAGISDDLREHVAPDKLQHEVEKELEDQILAQLVKAIGEYNGVRHYSREDQVAVKSKRKQCLRFMGYCNEMWVKIEAVKGVLGSGDLASADEVEFEVAS